MAESTADHVTDRSPRVSVVVPVFNKAPFLEACMESVFSQSFTDLEVIAVDDKSTDESLQLLRAMDDARLKVVALEQNLGPAGAAQRAMDLAQGEYIVRMDADDIMHPQRVERQVAFMDANPRIVASGGRIRLFGSEEVDWTFPLDPDDCRAELLFGVPVPQPASILRTQVLRSHNVRYQDHWPRIGEDWIYWMELAVHGEFANLDDVLLYYRRGEQNISHGMDLTILRKEGVKVVLEHFGLGSTDHDVEMHLLARKIFLRAPDQQRIRDYKAWLGHLEEHLKESFPHEALRRRLHKAWTEIFHYLPAYGWAAALEHLRLSKDRPWAHWSYLMKYRLKAGRRTSGKEMLPRA